MTSYCTPAELIAITGSVLTTAQLQTIIDDSGVNLDAYLQSKGYLASAASPQVKSACLKLSQAGMTRRFLISGENPPSENFGGYSYSNPSDYTTQIKLLTAEAFALLDQYVLLSQVTSVVPSVGENVTGVVFVQNYDRGGF